jgi:Na+/proline symporter
MITLLPKGIYGLVVAGLIAAYTSTIGTHLNWGSSYVVNDFYKRFLKPQASDKELVLVGRISTVVLMVLAGGVALVMTNAKDSFDLMLQIGAGTGLIYILRWFWWRINAWTEISAMIVSFAVALGFFFLKKNMAGADAITMALTDAAGNVIASNEIETNSAGRWLSAGHWLLESHWQLCVGIAITTVFWLTVTLLTKPEDDAVLRNFVRKTRPGGPGWAHIEDQIVSEGGHRVKPRLALRILCIFLGCFTVWGSLFCIGGLLYGKITQALSFGILAAVSLFLIFKVWSSISGEDE